MLQQEENMPTISEPVWPEVDEKINRIVADFMDGLDSPDVFKARLFGCNLRGQDLTAAYNVAVGAKINKGLEVNKRVAACKVLVMERGGANNTLRFRDSHYAGRAVELLRKQPNVLFACRVVW